MDIASADRLADPIDPANTADTVATDPACSAGRNPQPSSTAIKRRRIRVPKPEFAVPAATLDAMAALMAQVAPPDAAASLDRRRADRIDRAAATATVA